MDVFLNNQYSIILVLIFFGAFNGYLLSFIFFTHRKGNKTANRLFALLILVPSLRLTEVCLLLTGLLQHVPFLAGTTYPLLFLIGPVFYLYSKYLLQENFKIHWSYVLMLLPLCLAFWRMWGWIFLDLTIKAEILAGIKPWENPQITFSNFIEFGALIVHTAVYVLLVIKSMSLYKLKLVNLSSDNRVLLNYNWMRNVTIGLLVYVCGFFITMGLLAYFQQYSIIIDRLWLFLLTTLILSIGYFAIRQPEYFHYNNNKDFALQKIRQPLLPQEQSREYYEKVLEYLQSEKPYLNPNLKAADVAKALQIPVYQLSYIINNESSYNFFDLINKHRVEEVIRILNSTEGKKLKLLAIAFDAGFNSKAPFNRAFKKFTNKTPSKFS
jgi:AraC-like DNA-binding protein